jgi:hypothetical protein
MMKSSLQYGMTGLAIGVVMVAWGCVTVPAGLAGGGSNTFTVTLDGDLADFDVEAGAPSEKIISIPSVGAMITGGTFTFDTDSITFTPTGPAKGVVSAQTGPFDLEVTGFAFPRDPLGACGDGDQYGPYTVGIDANGNAVSIDPAQLTLMPDTVGLINDDNLAICIRVVSPVSGVARVGAMEFKISAGTTDTQ